MPATDPKALKLIGETCDGFILQLADPSIAEWTIGAVRAAATEAGRDPDDITICVAAPAYVGDDLAYLRDQVRWFGGMVGNHVADIVERYGEDVAGARGAHRVHQEPPGLRLQPARRARRASTSTSSPTRSIDRFCILGPVEAHLARLDELKALGVDQFAIYLQHDGKDHTLAEYGEKIIPAAHRTGAGQEVSAEQRSPTAGRAGRTRAVRRTALLLAALGLAAIAWEVYKAIGPEQGGDVFGWRIIPKTNDRVMPHVWEMLAEFGDPAIGSGDQKVWSVLLGYSWYTLRMALAGPRASAPRSVSDSPC